MSDKGKKTAVGQFTEKGFIFSKKVEDGGQIKRYLLKLGMFCNAIRFNTPFSVPSKSSKTNIVFS